MPRFVTATFLGVTMLYTTGFATAETGSLQAALNMNGVHAVFTFTPLGNDLPGARVDISGLITAKPVHPESGFEYHIHDNPVGPGNDCQATGGHLDPTQVGPDKCDPSKPEKCQEGDLSGKHGNLKPSSAGILGTISYVDRELQFEGAKTTIVGRSVVVHNNGARIACANIESMDDKDNDDNDDDKNNNSDSVKHQLMQVDERDHDSDSDSTTDDFDRKHILVTSTIGPAQGADGKTAMASAGGRVAMWAVATTLAAGFVAAMMAL
ncbi:hypothetical protein BGZ94_002023 [Podila epigama]|nr:hypothetical protein BGZ94_002023 [Podila epigama]